MFRVKPEYSSFIIRKEEEYTSEGSGVVSQTTPELQYLPELASTNIDIMEGAESPLISLDPYQVYSHSGGDTVPPLSSRYGDILGTSTINHENDLIYNSPTLDIDNILSFYETDSDAEELPLLSGSSIDCVEVGVARVEKITLLEEKGIVSGVDLSPGLSYSLSLKPTSSAISPIDSGNPVYYTIHHDLNSTTGSICTSPISDFNIPASDRDFDESNDSFPVPSSGMQSSMLHCSVTDEHLINPVNCSYHHTIENLFTKADENVQKIKSPASHKSLLEVLTESIPASPGTGDSHKVMIMLRAPPHKLSQFQSTYLRDESDMEYTKTVNDVLRSVLSQVTGNEPPGHLRFSTEIILGAIEGWMNVHMYVYERIILFISNGNLYSTVNLVNEFKKVVSDKEDPRYIYIYSKATGSQPTSLYVLKRSISHMLVELLQNPALDFPLNRDTFNKYWLSMEQQMNDGSFHNPRKIQSLLFIPYRIFQSHRGLEVIQSKVRDIEPMEELAIVVYSGEGIHYNGDFQGKMWGGWKSLVNREFASNHKDCHIPGIYKENAMEMGSMVHDSSVRDDILCDSSTGETTPSERRMRMDELMILASEKFGSYTPDTVIANLVLIADNSLLPQYNESEMLVSSGISITAIGTSETHDAMSLLRLVTRIGGTYSYARSYDELSETISRCHSAVKRGALHNVKVKMRLRLGTEANNFLCGDMIGRNKPKLLSAEDRLYEWDIGSFGAEDVRTIIVSIKGELPESQPVIRLTLDFDNHLENHCEKMNYTINAVHIPADTMQDDKRNWLFSMVHLEEVMVDVCRVLERAIWLCVFQEPLRAASILYQHLMRMTETRNPWRGVLIPEMVNIIDGFEYMVEEHHSAVSASYIIKRQTVLMMVRNLWVLYQKRSFCGTNKFDTIFR